MDRATHKKHKRSYSISRFEELNLNLQEKIEIFEETSTKESPERETPIQVLYLTEVNKLIDQITKENLKKEKEKRLKSREFRNLLIKELYRNKSIQNMKVQKRRKINKSVEKIVFKVNNVKKVKTGNRAKGKKPLLIKKIGENPLKFGGIERNSTKSCRAGLKTIH